MKPVPPSMRPDRIDWKMGSLLVAGLLITLLVAANVHLVYVALTSQPDCVPHVKAAQENSTGAYRAARSSC